MADGPGIRWMRYMELRGMRSYRDVVNRPDPPLSIKHETVRRVMQGKNVSRHSIEEVARALRIDPEMVHELRNEEPPLDQWMPPESARLLDHEEREVLARLIATMTRNRAARPSLSAVDDELSFRAGQDAARRGEAGDEGVGGGPSL